MAGFISYIMNRQHAADRSFSTANNQLGIFSDHPNYETLGKVGPRLPSDTRPSPKTKLHPLPSSSTLSRCYHAQ